MAVIRPSASQQYCLPPTKEDVYVFARVRLSVCSVCEQDYSKRRAWIWMKCCVSTDVGTWTNWLTFEPGPDYSLDAGNGLLSPISYALQRGILLRRENPTYRYWAAATRNFTMALFAASRRNNFVGGTCALPSVLLVFFAISDIKVGTCVPNNMFLECAKIHTNQSGRFKHVRNQSKWTHFYGHPIGIFTARKYHFIKPVRYTKWQRDVL